MEQPFWELDGNTDFPSVLRALVALLPEGSVLYFEDGRPTGRLLEFIESHRIDPQSHVAAGTIWPRPWFYHIPATAANLLELAGLLGEFAESELAIHFHVYCAEKIILEWHDAFTQPMHLAGTFQEEKVTMFGEGLNMRIRKCESGRLELSISRKIPPI